MPRADSYEPPLRCVLDAHDVDQLLEKLRAVHGEPRADIAPELRAAARPQRVSEQGLPVSG